MAEALPTQEIIAVDRIENDALILKNGALRKVLMVSGINFALKSEEEQNLIIFTYQNFLNSLNFSLQQFIHTRKLNIDDYLAKIAQLQNSEKSDLLKNLIGEYKEFVGSLVAQNPIMSKSFFVIVPYDPVNIPEAGKAVFKKFFGLFRKNDIQSAEQSPAESLRDHGAGPTAPENFSQLEQRVDQVTAGLSQIGLRVVPLNKEELSELLYNLYNPETIERKKA